MTVNWFIWIIDKCTDIHMLFYRHFMQSMWHLWFTSLSSGLCLKIICSFHFFFQNSKIQLKIYIFYLKLCKELDFLLPAIWWCFGFFIVLYWPKRYQLKKAFFESLSELPFLLSFPISTHRCSHWPDSLFVNPPNGVAFWIMDSDCSRTVKP